jgi:RNA polymerase sigma-70 factor (sigma-E family)
VQVRADDEAAFREFVTTRSAALLRTAYLLTGDRGLAEDAVQSMLGRVFLRWNKVRDREAIDAYCRVALVREVSSWHRRRQVRHVLTAEVPESLHPTTGEQSDPDDDLRRALTALPPRQRAVLVLRYFDDMSEAEVAAALGVSRGSIKQHTSRALSALRTALGEPQRIEERER